MSSPIFNLYYKGDALKGEKLQKAKDILGDETPYAYLPDDGLIEAVNLAMYLKRPLLLKGEPGCGKTRLAEAIAWELYGEKYESEYRKFYKEWHIKSTSQARDGLYRFDHIAQLRDTQRDIDNRPKTYVKEGPLGEVFAIPEERPVLLIDEIDKADLDFPNDLLRELDRYEYTVDELDDEDEDVIKNKSIKHRKAQQIPIVIITSNDEKELPEAFLRRCVYYYIDFPDEERLSEIVESHFPGKLTESFLQTAIGEFVSLRKRIKADSEQQKNVSTSELIDWFKFITGHENLITEKELKAGKMPFLQLLIKGLKDVQRFFRSKTDE